MRHGYWFDAIMGLTLLLVPLLRGFAQGWRLHFLDVVVALSLLAWAIVSYLNPWELKPQANRHGSA